MKNVLPFEKLYRNRIVWLVSAGGDLILQGVVEWRAPNCRSFAVSCINSGIKIITRSPLHASSAVPIFYSLYYPCSTKRAALRLSAILRDKHYGKIKRVLSDRFKFKQIATRHRGKIHIIATDNPPLPDRAIDVEVTLETRNTFKHATETHMTIEKGRDPNHQHFDFSLPSEETFVSRLRASAFAAPDKTPAFTVRGENFWANDGDKE